MALNRNRISYGVGVLLMSPLKTLLSDHAKVFYKKYRGWNGLGLILCFTTAKIAPRCQLRILLFLSQKLDRENVISGRYYKVIRLVKCELTGDFVQLLEQQE